MSGFDFDDAPIARDPKVVVAENMARLKTVAPKAEKSIAMDAATRAKLAELDRRDGFLRLPGGRLISPTLAHQLHYRETPPAPAAGPAIDDSDAEARSMDEARR